VLELWAPAAGLEAFNARIVGGIVARYDTVSD